MIGKSATIPTSAGINSEPELTIYTTLPLAYANCTAWVVEGLAVSCNPIDVIFVGPNPKTLSGPIFVYAVPSKTFN